MKANEIAVENDERAVKSDELAMKVNESAIGVAETATNSMERNNNRKHSNPVDGIATSAMHRKAIKKREKRITREWHSNAVR